MVRIEVAVKWVGAGSPRPYNDAAENGGRGNPAPTTPTTNIACMRGTWCQKEFLPNLLNPQKSPTLPILIEK
jgi:hypothetical protein